MTLTRTVVGLLFSDDFNRANGAPGSNYTIGTGNWLIASNKLSLLTTTSIHEITVTGAGIRQNSHAQFTTRRDNLAAYSGVILRHYTTGYTFWFQGDTGATTDGDANKPRVYSHLSGTYSKFAVGATGQAGLVNTDTLMKFSAINAPNSTVRFDCNGFVSSTVDANAQTNVAGAIKLYVVSGGGTGFTVTFEDLIITTTRTVSATGLPTGHKIRVGGVGGVTSAAESGGAASVDMLAVLMPALLEVLDASNNIVDSSAGVAYGGDTFAYTGQGLALTAGGGQVAAVGTAASNGALAVTAGGGRVAAVGTVSLIGTMSIGAGGGEVAIVAAEVFDNPYPLGRRELQADFNGIRTNNISITKRPDAISFDYLTAFSMGPTSRGFTDDGIAVRPWYVRADNSSQVIFVARANDANDAWEAEIVLLNFTGAQLEEIDVAFDQSGNIVVCVERNSGVGGAKQIWLYWFKPAVLGFVFEIVEGGRTPRILLDNPHDVSNSDVILFYLKTGVGLVYRMQRELYTPSHGTPHVEEADWYVEDAYYTKGWRVGLMLTQHNSGGTYGKKRMETALMPVYGQIDFTTLGAEFNQVDGVLRQTLIIFTDDDVTYPGRVGPAFKDEDLAILGFIDATFGTLRDVLITHDLYEWEAFTVSGDITAGGATLLATGSPVIAHDLYDVDELKVATAFGAGGQLYVALITVTLWDVDSLKVASAFGTGGTLA